VYDQTRFAKLKNVVVCSLCLLEKVFPPNFFDLMTHVVIHLDELELCGLVHTRWIYLIECAMKDLKGCVYNMAKPEGFMANGYIVDEALGL
jgi:hypothetical protein